MKPATLLAIAIVSGAARMAVPQAPTPQPREAQRTASPEIQELVRHALQDRFMAHDIPDIDLLDGVAHVLVLKEMSRAGLQLSAGALPTIGGTRFELIGTDEAKARAERRNEDVVYLMVDDPQIEGDQAFLWLGTDLTVPPKAGLVKMCCCTGRAEFRKTSGRWAFVKWRAMNCS